MMNVDRLAIAKELVQQKYNYSAAYGPNGREQHILNDAKLHAREWEFNFVIDAVLKLVDKPKPDTQPVVEAAMRFREAYKAMMRTDYTKPDYTVKYHEAADARKKLHEIVDNYAKELHGVEG